MNNIFVYPEALAAARESGITAVFIETRTASSRGSNYTSFSLEILVKGQAYATLLLLGERVNGCDYYARQLAAEAMTKLGLTPTVHFRCHKFVKNADHVQRPVYTTLVPLDDAIKGSK